jgi:hypothetical protein
MFGVGLDECGKCVSRERIGDGDYYLHAKGMVVTARRGPVLVADRAIVMGGRTNVRSIR